jgi:hypothetical protein
MVLEQESAKRSTFTQYYQSGRNFGQPLTNGDEPNHEGSAHLNGSGNENENAGPPGQSYVSKHHLTKLLYSKAISSFLEVLTWFCSYGPGILCRAGTAACKD